jgi:hypothetical protein
MIRFSNFEERMSVDLFSLTSFAEIKIRAYTTLVADTLNRASTTTIASHSIMNLSSLVSGSLAKVINHQSLESLSGVGLDFILDNLDKIDVELVLESARAIASSAWHSSLVNLGAVTFEADNTLLIVDVLLLVLWTENLAVNFLRDSLSLELATFALSLNRAIAKGLSDIFLNLRSSVLSYYNSVELLFVSLDLIGVTTEVLVVNQVVHIGRGFCVRMIDWTLTTNGDTVSRGFGGLNFLVNNRS